MDVDQVAAAAHLMAAAELYGHHLHMRCLGRSEQRGGTVIVKYWCARCHTKHVTSLRSVPTGKDVPTMAEWMTAACKARAGA